MSPVRSIRILCFAFLAVGLVALAAAVFWYFHTSSFLAGAATAKGIVVELVPRTSRRGLVYAPRVEFAAPDGSRGMLISSVGSDPPSYSRGDAVEVLYDPRNINKARLKSFAELWLGPSIFAGLGVIFGGIGLGILLFQRRQGGARRWLQAGGRRIEADYEGVELNTSLTVGGRNPFRILAQWQDPMTSRIHVFHSENLWFDPQKYIERKTLTVYVDPNNPKKYYVDVSFLPKLAD